MNTQLDLNIECIHGMGYWRREGGEQSDGGKKGRERKSELGEGNDKGGLTLMSFCLSFVISLRSWVEGDILRAISGD